MAAKKGLVSYRKKISAAKKAKSTASKALGNPAIIEDLTEQMLPGFAAYAGTRFLTRLVHNLASQRFPNGGRHLAVGSAVLAGLGVYYLTDRLESTKRYSGPASVGAAIAAIQTGIQVYIPKWGWMISDIEKEDEASAKVPTSLPDMPELPEDMSRMAQMRSQQLELDGISGDDYGSLGGGGLSDADLDALEAELLG